MLTAAERWRLTTIGMCTDVTAPQEPVRMERVLEDYYIEHKSVHCEANSESCVVMVKPLILLEVNFHCTP